MPMSRLPSLLSLRAFEAAARRGSIKEAASELAVTPGAVSQQIKALEADLGVDLFIRKTRAIELTRQGRQLQPTMTESFLKMRQAVDEVRPGQAQHLNIYAAGMIIRSWLLPNLHRFTSANPDVETKIETLHSWEAFGFGEDEIAFRLAATPPKDVYARPIHKLILLPVATREFIERHEIKTAEDFYRLPLLEDVILRLFGDDAAWDLWFEAAGLTRGRPDYEMTFDPLSADYALDMALDGQGVMLGWSIQVYQALSQGRLQFVGGPVLETGFTYYLMCNKTQAKKPHVNAFMDWVEKEAAVLSTLNSLQTGAA
ncbi:MAG: LysR family transcriptional regulator [Pseudomonadota bacterium]